LAQRLMVATFPIDPDAWSETLTPPEGRWESMATEPNEYLELDTANKVVGNASVHVFCYYKYYNGLWFILNDVFDGTKPNAKLNFWMAISEGSSGRCWVALNDKDGRTVRRYFDQLIGQFQERSFGLAWDEANWEVYPEGFDWANIKEIHFYADQEYYSSNHVWVDQPHFSWEVPAGSIIVESVPTGKTGTMTYQGSTFNITTPASTPELPEGTEVIISMDPVDFKQWENGDTNPTRVEHVIAGVKTIKAYYSTAELPSLEILSFDENGQNFPGQQAVKIVYAGIEQYLDVPFSGKVSKGQYTLVAVPPDDRTFDFWKKPDGTTTTEQFIDVNIQDDTVVEVHWLRKGAIPNWLFLIGGAILIGGIIILLSGD